LRTVGLMSMSARSHFTSSVSKHESRCVINWCRLRCSSRVNCRAHTEHTNGFSCVCTCAKWRISAASPMNIDSSAQTRHLNLRAFDGDWLVDCTCMDSSALSDCWRLRTRNVDFLLFDAGVIIE
jgi:hypothetical protein